MHPYIDKCTKVDYIPHGPLQDHSRLQVFHVQYIRAKDRLGHVASRIASGFLQFGGDVDQRLGSCSQFLRCLFRFPAVLHLHTQTADLTAFHILQGVAQLLQQFSGSLIGLRMYTCHIQRVAASADPQEPCTLLICFRTQSGNLQQLPSVRKSAVFISPVNDGSSRLLRDAGDIFQKGIGGCIQIDADLVDAGLDHTFQLPPEFLLITVMLILSDADRLRIDLDQLRQRILQAARDGCGTSLSHIEFGEFLRCQFACRIDGSSGFIDDHIVHLLRSGAIDFRQDLRDHLLGFPRCSAVSAGNECDMVFRDQALDRLLRSFDLCGCCRRRRINHRGIQNFTGAVNDCDLATCPKGRVPSEDDLSRDRRLHQKLPQVLSEHFDCPVLRLLRQRIAKFSLDRRRDQSAV